MNRMRVFACTAVVLTCGASALIACGGGGGDGDGSAGAAAATSADQQSGSSTPAGAEREIRAMVARFQDLFYSGDAAGVCALHTEQARRAVAASGPSDATCESVFAPLAKRVPAATAQRYKARVVSVRINGDRATIRTIQGQAQRPSEVRLARVGDEWLVNQGLTAEPPQ